MLNTLDLFSGIGGFSLGLERTGGFHTVAFCEIEEFPRKVLRKHWPDIPIFNDVRRLHAEDLPEPVDVICGGYPCQPFSLAGKRHGEEDNRHLWPEMFRLVQEIRPYWIIAENVVGHVNMGLDQVLVDLESEGYETTAFIIPACSVNAPHRRDRVWIIGNSAGCRLSGDTRRPSRSQLEERYSIPADSDSERLQGYWKFDQCSGQRSSWSPDWKRNIVEVASDLCRMDDGLSGRMDRAAGIPANPTEKKTAAGRQHRLKALGNAVVPHVVEVIGKAIISSLIPSFSEMAS